MSHHCHARGCKKKCPPKALMCAMHWAMVAPVLQADVWRTYRPGQEIKKNPSNEWMQAADAAIDYVAKMERKGETKVDSKASIVKALERARDEIVSALNLINSGVINPAATTPADDSFGGDDFGAIPDAPAAEPAKRGRGKAKAGPAPASDADPFAEALADAGTPAGGADDAGFFSEQPAVDTGPTEKAVNDALVSAVASLVARAKQAGTEMKKTDARDKVLDALEKKFGSKNPASLKPKWAEVIAYFNPKK